MKSIKTFVPHLFMLVIILFLILMGIIYRGDSVRINFNEAKPLNTGWTHVETGVAIDTLPAELDVNQGESYTISIILDDHFERENVLLIRASLSDLVVRLNGEMIHERVHGTASSFDLYASTWSLVTIPDHASGKVLELEFMSPYEAFSGTLNAIHYGTDAEVWHHMVLGYLPRFISGVVMLLIGIAILIINLAVDRFHHSGKAFLGVFAVMLSFWIFGESRLLQLLIGSRFIHGGMTYLMVALMPIPIAHYIKKSMFPKYQKVFTIACLCYSMNALVVILLQATGIMDFFQSVMISQILILIGIILISTVLVLEYRLNRIAALSKSLKYYLILVIFGLFELIVYFTGNFDNTSVFLIIGFVVFMIVQLHEYIKQIIQALRKASQTEVYEKLAYTDRLTGANNRSAYEEAFDKIFASEQTLKKVRLAFFDFDDLKSINDTYGHLEGDDLLKTGFLAINDVFSKQGVCYRIGGDEFACILEDVDDKVYQTMVEAFKNQIGSIAEDRGYPIRISVGQALFDRTNDTKPSDLMKRADADMYRNKTLHKLI
jgi:diguanylate cyclase